MAEQQREHFEHVFETIPTPEEVFLIFKELAPEGFIETRRGEDGRGLYFLEIQTKGKNENEYTEFSYMRKGRYPEGRTLATEITVTYYQDQTPINGTTAAKYESGKWRVVL